MTDGSDIPDDMIDAPDVPSDADLMALRERLKSEHRRIDAEIHALDINGVTDMLKVKRMKKIKLSMKDQITYLDNILTPDIIA